MMSLSALAKILGSRGGRARAQRLSPERKKGIARHGALARIEAIKTVRRIQENFYYYLAMNELAPLSKVETVKNTKDRLPGIYV